MGAAATPSSCRAPADTDKLVLVVTYHISYLGVTKLLLSWQQANRASRHTAHFGLAPYVTLEEVCQLSYTARKYFLKSVTFNWHVANLYSSVSFRLRYQ